MDRWWPTLLHLQALHPVTSEARPPREGAGGLPPRRTANGPISSTSLKTSSGSFRAVSRNVASVQALPGTATLTLSTLAHTGVVGGAVLRYIMEFTCLVVMQLYLSFWGLAAVTAWGNHCSEASLEDRAASKGVRPGSASRFPNSIPDMNTSKGNSEEIVDTMVSQKVIPWRSCGAAQAKPVKTKRYTAMVTRQ